MPFSHHIPNDRQHKFFNFIGRNSFFFLFAFAFQVMHRKLITFWIPSKYWLRISSSFLHFDILDMLLIAKFIHFSYVHYLFEYSNQRNWSTTKNVNYIHELVYRFYFTSPQIGTHMGRDRNREEVSWHFNMCRRVKLELKMQRCYDMQSNLSFSSALNLRRSWNVVHEWQVERIYGVNWIIGFLGFELVSNLPVFKKLKFFSHFKKFFVIFCELMKTWPTFWIDNSTKKYQKLIKQSYKL